MDDLDLNLRARAERVQLDIEADRTAPDDELRQHARDLTFLMQSAYDLFQATGDEEHRQEAYARMHQRDQANQRLSPAWKARREAEIACAIGSARFMEDGERDQAALAANEERGRG